MPGIEEAVGGILAECSACLAGVELFCCGGMFSECTTTVALALYRTCNTLLTSWNNICTGLPIQVLTGIWSACIMPSGFCGSFCDILTIPFGILGPCNTIWSIPQFCIYGGLSIGLRGGWEWSLERGGIRAILSNLTACCDASMQMVDIPLQCISMASTISWKMGKVLNYVTGGLGAVCQAAGYIFECAGFICEIPQTFLGLGYICCTLPRFLMDAVCTLQSLPSLLFETFHTLCDLPPKLVKICLGKDIVESLTGLIEPLTLCFLSLNQICGLTSCICQEPLSFMVR
jgi:hypothetical protein